ncbi:MAG: AgmX/PglI C-terminal domain-containing protein [Candidatus Lernaella stagnicola]|nr:AgmX/PglI C-terminal domain-containing protein [Candidatus Lernaella stagnicola]
MRYLVLFCLAIAALTPLLADAAEPEQIDIESISGRRYKLALHRSMETITKCYDDALKKNASLAGRLVVRVDIDAGGKTAGVQARDDTLGNAGVTKCIVEALHEKTWPSADAPRYFETVFKFAATPTK